jgi:Rrf2 family nitric oxide-sensitive transcriptional repressor
MQLTQFTDYSLRILLYLAHHPPQDGERLPAVLDISRAYGISTNHLSKVARLLVQNGFVKATRGRNGGLQLAKTPEEINLGEVVRKSEPHFDLVECFDSRTNTCPIASAVRSRTYWPTRSGILWRRWKNRRSPMLSGLA